MELLIKGGRVIDPASGRDEIADVLVRDGVIAAIGAGLQTTGETIDAAGLWVTPGLIDIHTHLREPGYEYKEDVATGARAAAAGGFTAVCCMANTDPVNDSAAVTRLILDRAAEAGQARVYPIGAATSGLHGEDMAPIGELVETGCVAFSDDGHPIASGRLMRLCMQYANQFGKKIISHAEDLDLVAGGLMNEGHEATRAGLRGNTRAAEETMVARDIVIAKAYGLPVHIAHVSTRGSVDLVRWGKSLGVQVTAETAPHYLAGTDALCATWDAKAKVNPPLRTQDDQQALIEGLLDGTVDCIATDHAPHHADEKNVEFELAANGISGLETAFTLSKKALVDSGLATPMQLIDLMSHAPAKVLGLPGGALQIGAAADISLFDPDVAWVIDPEKFVSKGKNSPFGGVEVVGKAVGVLVGGNKVL